MRPVSTILTTVLPTLLQRVPLTPEKVEFAWRTVAGDALARVTRVDLRDGVLWVSAEDPRWLAEVTRARQALLPRLRSLLGDDAVRVIKTISNP